MSNSTTHLGMLESTLYEFGDRLASPDPVPGGGSVAALVGALGAALVSMVAGLTVQSPKYAEVSTDMKVFLGQSEALRETLQDLVEKDAAAYAEVAAAFKLPKVDEAERAHRTAVLQKALVGATETPLAVQGAACRVAELALQVAELGNRNAVSDAGVAALLAEAAARAAAFNVMTNVALLKDSLRAQAYLAEAEALVARAAETAGRALEVTRAALAT